MKQIFTLHRDPRRKADLDKWLEFIVNLPRNKEFRFTIEPQRSKYSQGQRSLLHLWMREIGEFTGMGEGDVKDYFKHHESKTWPFEDTPLGRQPKHTEHLYKDEATDVMLLVEKVARDIPGLVLSRYEG